MLYFKKLFLIFTLTLHSLLFSQQYEILPLGPTGEEYRFHINSEFRNFPKIYDDGKIIGAIGLNQEVFLYTPEKGFKIIDIFHSQEAYPIMMNKNGIIIGKFKTIEGKYHIFAYNINTEARLCTNLMFLSAHGLSD